MKEIEDELQSYYKENLDQFGLTAQGVGWKNQEAQERRFCQFLYLLKREETFSVNDLGCGTGDLLSFLLEHSYLFSSYRGYDVLEDMIQRAQVRFASLEEAQFYHSTMPVTMERADYTLASGIFNLKYSVSGKDWMDYIVQTIDSMDKVSTKGFAFNMLTTYSDKELMKSHLYYGDPLFFFDHCKRNYSKSVALLHNYNEYDFTIIVDK
jgi:SAM-dependent methyltransferase